MSSIPKPVARIVILTFVPNVLSIAVPQITSMSRPKRDIKSCTSFISSIRNSASSPNDTLNNIFLALNTSLLFSSGEFRASSIAWRTRPSPSPKPLLIRATPPSFIVVLTSAKSRLIIPGRVMISAMLLAAMVKVSSAFPKAFVMVRSEYISRRRSLLITSKASTFLLISSTPFNAWMILRSPSKTKGIVTIPTVSIPISLAKRAITGAAPVPVPPPIPAVIKTILVPSLSILRISSILSSAAIMARSGLFPAPSPWVMLRPRGTLTGTSERFSAWLSVLHRTNVTSCIPSLYMWVTALPPPPPTPITLMILGVSVG